jgi:hypothetical protein
MLKKILLIIAGLAVVFAIIVSLQPSGFRVTRSTAITAQPATVFLLVNDFRNWDSWSPWAKLDPSMKTSFEGPAAGRGAAYAWSGNRQVGEGRMTIVECRPEDLVTIALEFLKPFKASNTAEFTFKAEGGQTIVT